MELSAMVLVTFIALTKYFKCYTNPYNKEL